VVRADEEIYHKGMVVELRSKKVLTPLETKKKEG